MIYKLSLKLTLRCELVNFPPHHTLELSMSYSTQISAMYQFDITKLAVQIKAKMNGMGYINQCGHSNDQK